MTRKEFEINNEAKLIKIVSNFIDSLPKEYKLYICGGHFPLYYDMKTQQVFEGIYQEIKNPDTREDIRDNFGQFPMYTWNLSCDIAKKSIEKGRKTKLVLLINDWQEIPPVDNIDKSLPNPFRHKFYQNFNSLPTSYENRFKHNGLNFSKNIFRIEKGKFYLRELHLRDKFKRLIKRQFNQDIDISNCNYSEGDFIYNDEFLIKNGNAGCAGEISQMILDIQKETYNAAIINFLPLCCEKSVNQGTEMIYDLFGLSPIVLNVFLCTNKTISKSDFYNKQEENKNPRIFYYHRK